MPSKLLTLTIIAMGGLTLPACASPVPDQQVEPKEAQSLTPISLGALIYAALPKGELQWETLQIPEVRWITNGVATDAMGEQAHREGWARVRVDGKVSQVLQQNLVEAAWRIKLESDGLEKWGPKLLTIESGCFGRADRGCLFPATAISDPRMAVKPVCEAGPASPHYRVFQVRTDDGRVGTVSHHADGGSSGETDQIEISSTPPKEVCATVERDYPSR